MENCGYGDSTATSKNDELTKSVKARIERNRQKAVLLRQEKTNKRIYSKVDQEISSASSSKSSEPKKRDSDGGGFLLEDVGKSFAVKIVHKPGAILYEDERPKCTECDKTFNDSYLFDNFMEPVCDGCKDLEEKHRRITKTEAKATYLLKDSDLELREPPLKFMTIKNKKGWGEMKLYLECQVARRAAGVWESDEKLEEERLRREENKEKLKKKKYNKRMEDLRREVKASLYSKIVQAHKHDFGEESYRELDDTYSKTCKTCGHTMTYEKL